MHINAQLCVALQRRISLNEYQQAGFENGGAGIAGICGDAMAADDLGDPGRAAGGQPDQRAFATQAEDHTAIKVIQSAGGEDVYRLPHTQIEHTLNADVAGMIQVVATPLRWLAVLVQHADMNAVQPLFRHKGTNGIVVGQVDIFGVGRRRWWWKIGRWAGGWLRHARRIDDRKGKGL